MSTYARVTGTTVGGTGVSGYDPASIWGGANPGAYIKAGKTYGPNDKWAMDRSFSRLFQGERGGDATFEDFLNLQKNPQALFSQAIMKGSPDFLAARRNFGA